MDRKIQSFVKDILLLIGKRHIRANTLMVLQMFYKPILTYKSIEIAEKLGLSVFQYFEKYTVYSFILYIIQLKYINYQ